MVSGYSVSKAAVVKYTENLALETSRHGIAVFSVHPGLLPVGMGEVAVDDDSPAGSDIGHVYAWVRQELDQGRGADPADAVELMVAPASGRYDELSGLQLSVHDDIDVVLAQLDDVRTEGLYLLGLHKLPPAVEQQRWHSRSA